MLKKFVDLILRSHVFVALAAALFTAQTLISSGNYIVKSYFILLIFSATLFIYNLAGIKILLPYSVKNKETRLLSDPPNSLHRILCLISLLIFLICISKTVFIERIILSVLGIISLAYVMPFTFYNKRVTGLRNIPYLKNIVLTFAWTVATALLPLIDKHNQAPLPHIIFICLKRFFFIFSLALVFDIRDYDQDLSSGMKTIANLLGVEKTKLLSYASLIIFVLCNYLHENYMRKFIWFPDLSLPLYLSAFLTGISITMINSSRKPAFYNFVIDGAMILQFVLVVIFLGMN